jgi:hypothetical protein
VCPLAIKTVHCDLIASNQPLNPDHKQTICIRPLCEDLKDKRRIPSAHPDKQISLDTGQHSAEALRLCGKVPVMYSVRLQSCSMRNAQTLYTPVSMSILLFKDPVRKAYTPCTSLSTGIVSFQGPVRNAQTPCTSVSIGMVSFKGPVRNVLTLCTSVCTGIVPVQRPCSTGCLLCDGVPGLPDTLPNRGVPGLPVVTLKRAHLSGKLLLENQSTEACYYLSLSANQTGGWVIRPACPRFEKAYSLVW